MKKFVDIVKDFLLFYYMPNFVEDIVRKMIPMMCNNLTLSFVKGFVIAGTLTTPLIWMYDTDRRPILYTRFV